MEPILTARIKNQLEQLATGHEFHAMFTHLRDYVSHAIERGRFTRAQAEADVELALNLAYAALNMDEYEHCYYAIQYLEQVRPYAFGEGTWYYQLSLALMATGQLEKALDEARQGVQVTPSYPWNWLNLAALEAHFGNRQTALDAAQTGQALAQNPEVFQHIRSEILAGASLEEMHRWCFVNPQGEPLAQNRRLGLCVLCNESRLQQAQAALEASDWTFQEPYCYCTVFYQNESISVRFDMNEAGVSKLDIHWLGQIIQRLPQLDEQAQQLVAKTHPAAWIRLVQLVIGCEPSLSMGYPVGRCAEEQLYAYATFAPDFALQPQLSYQSFYEPMGCESSEEPEQERIINYTPIQRQEFNRFVAENFGRPAYILTDPAPEGIQVDIVVIEPTGQKNYYILLTCGMGAVGMPLKRGQPHPEHMELVLCLPRDWQVKNDDERWSWPVDWLRQTARMPVLEGRSLALGDTIAKGRPFSAYTSMCGVFLSEQLGEVCIENKTFYNLPALLFYAMRPLYHQELAFVQQQGTEAFYRRMGQQGQQMTPYLQLGRENICGSLDHTSADLILRLQKYDKNEEYALIVQTIESLPPEQRSYRAITWLGYALNQLWRFTDALRWLETEKDTGSTDPAWLFQAGYACYYLDRYARGIHYFEQANLFCPGDEEICMFLQFAQLAAALPVCIKPFTLRADEFWQTKGNSCPQPQAGWAALPENLADQLEFAWHVRGVPAQPHTVYTRPSLHFESYQCNPEKTTSWHLRQDIIAGASGCMPLLKAYAAGDTQLMDTLQQQGCSAGFLAYNHTGRPRQSWIELRAQLEQQLAQAAQHSGVLLGGAVGTEFSYLDFLIFNLPEFLETATSCLAPYKLDGLSFHLFRRDAMGVSLCLER